MIWKESDINSLLIINASIQGPVPNIGNKPYEECVKLWERTKVILARKIAKDMNTCQEKNGNQFAVDVWHLVMRQITVKDWTRPCGVFPIWRNMYRNASAKVQENMPKTIQSVIHDAALDVLNKSIVKSANVE